MIKIYITSFMYRAVGFTSELRWFSKVAEWQMETWKPFPVKFLQSDFIYCQRGRK